MEFRATVGSGHVSIEQLIRLPDIIRRVPRNRVRLAIRFGRLFSGAWVALRQAAAVRNNVASSLRAPRGEIPNPQPLPPRL